MKNNFLKILVAVLAFVLIATVIVGVLPSFKEDEDSTTKKPGTSTDVNDPAVSTLSFPTSDMITTSFIAAAKNAAWTNTGDGEDVIWTYAEGSTARVALPPDFVMPEDEDLLFRLSSGIAPRLYGLDWEMLNHSVDLDSFKCCSTGELMFNFKNPDSNSCSVALLKENIRIYTRSEIQKNLQQANLSDEHLNELIDLLVCGGKYTESSFDKMMVWGTDYELSGSGGFYGNRICMRYSVSVPKDIKVTIDSEYDYVLYLFKDLTSMECTSTAGWVQASGDFVIPANTPFCIALKPSALSGEVNEENRHDYPYIYASEWTEIVSFELVK